MATGQRLTYTDSNIAKRGIADLIQMIDWTEAPLLNLLGLNNESKFRIVNWPSTKIEWMEDEMSSRQDALNDGTGINTSDTSIVVDDGSKFKEGDVVQFDGSDELIYISAVSSNTLTGVRGFASTTAESVSDNTVLYLRTSARLEGADFDTGHTTTISLPYNHTQILAEAVKVSGSEQENTQYGISDQMAYHISKLIGGGNGMGSKGKAGKLAILLEQTFFYGMRDAGSSTTSRSMGGFDQYVTTNVTDKASAALTRKDIEDMFEDCYLAGGSPDTIICDAWGKRKISSFYEGLISTDRSEERGGSKITTVQTDFGDMSVEFCRWCPTGTMYMVEKDKMGWVTYRPFDIYDRASTGDYTVKDVLGEYSFVLVNEQAHGKIHTYSTTK